MSSPSLLPFQPMSMTTAQLAAVSFLARYAGRTHDLYAYQLRRWFGWCEGNGLDPLLGIQRAPTSSCTSAASARPASWRRQPTR